MKFNQIEPDNPFLVLYAKRYPFFNFFLFCGQPSHPLFVVLFYFIYFPRTSLTNGWYPWVKRFLRLRQTLLGWTRWPSSSSVAASWCLICSTGVTCSRNNASRLVRLSLFACHALDIVTIVILWMIVLPGNIKVSYFIFSN